MLCFFSWSTELLSSGINLSEPFVIKFSVGQRWGTVHQSLGNQEQTLFQAMKRGNLCGGTKASTAVTVTSTS